MNLKKSLGQRFLTQPDFAKEFILEIDASMYGLGAVQLQEDDENPRGPIVFISRTMTGTERQYSITEKKMLAGLWAMEYFRYYLYRREFIWRTDHKALKAFKL